MISIFIACTQWMFGQGLVRMFADDPRFQVLDWDSNGQEVLERIQALKPDLVILDRTMPKSGAAELMAGMAAAGIRIPCLVLNMMQGLGAPRGPRGGVAKGSLTLDASFEELTVLALATASGDAAQGDRGLPAWPESKWSGYELTRREAEVLRLVGQGLTSKKIGKILFISPRTVDSHRLRIMQKLDIANAPGLVKFAMENCLD